MKKKMKQITALGLAVMLLLGGCGQKNEIKEPEPVPEKEVTAELPKEEPKKEKVPFRVSIHPQEKIYYAEDGETVLTSLTYQDVTAEGDGFRKVKEALENWSLERSEELRGWAAELTKEYINQELTFARVDESVVSIMEKTWYGTTEQGSEEKSNTAVNFDVRSGRQLGFQDIIRDWDSFSEIAGQHLTDYLQSGAGEGAALDAVSAAQEFKDGLMEWYMDASGITVLLRDEFVAPEKAGKGQLQLSYQEFGQYIKEEYLPGDRRGIALIPTNQEVSAAVPGSQEAAFLMLKSDENGLVIWCGEAKERLTESEVPMLDAYLLNSGDALYALVGFDLASDDYETYVYRLESGKLQEINWLRGRVDRNTLTADSFVLETPVYMLGTYQARKTYRMGEGGKFFTEGTEYAFWNNEFVLTTKTELPVTLEGADNILPAGSNIVLTATDDETYVRFRIQETGQEGILAVERNPDPEVYPNITIDGKNENDCFELLPYAG